MPILYEGDTIRLDGVCSVEEVDGLLAFLEGHPGAVMSLERCEHLHTAVLQTLLAYRVNLVGDVASPFLSKWVAPAFERVRAGAKGD